MAKFKVGDKVVFSKKLVKDERYDGFTYLPNIIPKGIEFEVVDVNPDSMGVWYGVKSESDGRVGVYSEMIELIEQPRREFIVINRSGNVMTAEHRVNRDVIESAKATCAPSDTFDFDKGAKLAFDRLMGREVPKTAPKKLFKVGDRVVTSMGRGKVAMVDADSDTMPYWISYDDGRTFWMNSGTARLEQTSPQPAHKKTWVESTVASSLSKYKVGQRINHKFLGEMTVAGFEYPSWIWCVRDDGEYFPTIERNLSTAPAPEPPKYYTGKVVCIENKRFPEKVGLVASIINGVCSHGNWKRMTLVPFESFESFCATNSNAKFIEVKE